MQERASMQTSTCGNSTSMESADSVDIDDSSDLQREQSTRSRNSNNKLKVLVRSHAMREASPSPPRDPQSPGAHPPPPPTTAHQHHYHSQSPPQPLLPPPVSSPCIKLTPSSDSQHSSPTRTLLVLSPSASPTSTLVASPSPTRHADQSEFSHPDAGYSPDVGHRCTKNTKHARRKHHYERDDDQRHNGGGINMGGANMGGANGGGANGGMKCECLTNLNNNNLHNNNNNTLTVSNRFAGSGNGRGKLRQQSSSLGSFDGSTPTLSRDNSAEQYTDTTGADLELFIPETLNRNQKDRNLMLRIEEELVQLAKDDGKTHFKFPPMSSYQRMLVHRCAAYFGMEHNIESTGKCVVVNKTKNTRIPEIEFKFHIKEEYNEEPRRSILKRDSNSIEDYNFKSPDRQYSLESRRSKSFEEREEEYEKAKRRIFNKGNHNCSNEDIAWGDEIGWSNNDHDTKYRLHADYHHPRSTRLLKVQSEDPGEETMRPCVAKSFSFGGYGGALTRGDSMMSTHSAGPRLFSKQDSSASSVSWHLSPSSSGYKTQSQRSESITPSPTSTPFYSSNDSSSNRQDSTATNASDIPLHGDDDNQQQVVWAVTNIQSVPKGSVIINPQTLQPIKNHDGSLYHHDPDNPLPELPVPEVKAVPTPVVPTPAAVSVKPPMSPVKTKKERPTTPKKRSPIKKTNSATSPSLPYTPPPAAPSLTNVAVNAIPPIPIATQVVQKSFSAFTDQGQAQVMQSQYYGTAFDYPQPCIVYAPYGQVPVGYETRIETTQMQDLAQPYFVDPTNPMYPPPPPPPQAAPAGVWPQTQYVYSNTPRFVQPTPTTFITSYPAAQTTCGFVPQAPSTGGPPEMIPVYPTQSLIYPTAQTSVFPNQNMIYAAPPPAPVFPAPPPQTGHNMAYPVNASTPNGVYQMEQMVHGVQQLHLGHPNGGGAKDERRMTLPKGRGRSQSSTEANSPATAVMAFPGGAVYHRQNSETPPSLPPTPGYGGAFPPMFIRQMSNVRASPPMQSRASRSPTPVTPTMPMPLPPAPLAAAPEMIDARHRYAMPPIVYQTMPYSIPSDSRLVTGRAYRQPSPRPAHNHAHSSSQPHPPPPQQHHQQHAPPTATPTANHSNSNSNSHACGVAQYNQATPPAHDKFRNRKNRSNKSINPQFTNKRP